MKIKQPLSSIVRGLAALLLCASAAQAWHISGRVICDENGNRRIDTGDHAIAGVMIAVEARSGASFTAFSGADGSFRIELPHNADSYLAYLHPPSLPPGASVLLPSGGVYSFSLTNESQFFEQADFLLNCAPEETTPPPGGDCGKVTGGGWIVGTPSGAKGSFGVSGGMKGSDFWGHLNFVDHGDGLHVRSTAVTGYDPDPESANGRIIKYNVLVGTTEATAVVRVVDNGEPGRNDIFELTLSTGYTAKGELGGDRPGGGNIQLHKCPPGKSKDK